MRRTRTYDPRCYDLAELFLEDEKHLGGERNCELLALEIQRTIEDFIAERTAELVEREAEYRLEDKRNEVWETNSD
jgi:hypothetical protein